MKDEAGRRDTHRIQGGIEPDRPRRTRDRWQRPNGEAIVELSRPRAPPLGRPGACLAARIETPKALVATAAMAALAFPSLIASSNERDHWAPAGCGPAGGPVRPWPRGVHDA